MDYQIFTDATADANEELLARYPDVRVIPMGVEICDRAYTYGPGGDITVDEFYALQRAGNYAASSQINPSVYTQYFTEALEQGRDVLYLCFSSGLSGTIQAARLCIQELQEQYPQRKILCIDTLCASAGEGFLVCEAARKQAEGYSFDALADWVNAHRLQVCHWFTVDVFDHLQHGGRVSAATAVVGTALQIKPLLHVDEEGKLAVMEKPRGRKRAIQAQLAHMEAGWTPEESRLVFVCHGDCPEGAQLLRQAVEERFPDADIWTTDIGPVIGAHTGPGMLALIYWGTTR